MTHPHTRTPRKVTVATTHTATVQSSTDGMSHTTVRVTPGEAPDHDAAFTVTLAGYSQDGSVLDAVDRNLIEAGWFPCTAWQPAENGFDAEVVRIRPRRELDTTIAAGARVNLYQRHNGEADLGFAPIATVLQVADDHRSALVQWDGDPSPSWRGCYGLLQATVWASRLEQVAASLERRANEGVERSREILGIAAELRNEAAQVRNTTSTEPDASTDAPPSPETDR